MAQVLEDACASGTREIRPTYEHGLSECSLPRVTHISRVTRAELSRCTRATHVLNLREKTSVRRRRLLQLALWVRNCCSRCETLLSDSFGFVWICSGLFGKGAYRQLVGAGILVLTPGWRNGRRGGLKHHWGNSWGFESPPRHQTLVLLPCFMEEGLPNTPEAQKLPWRLLCYQPSFSASFLGPQLDLFP